MVETAAGKPSDDPERATMSEAASDANAADF